MCRRICALLGHSFLIALYGSLSSIKLPDTAQGSWQHTMNWGSVHGRLSGDTEAAEVVNFMRASLLRIDLLDAQVEITLPDAEEPQINTSRRVPCSSARPSQPVWGGESLFAANAWFDGALSLSACHLVKAGGKYARQPSVKMGGRCSGKFLCHFF